MNRKGESEPLPLQPANYTGARISPDGSRLAIELQGDIWLYDVARGVMSRLTFTGDNFRPVWTPDGAHVVFSSSREGSDQVFWRRADGSGDAERLTSTEFSSHPDSVSPDGSIVVFHEHTPKNLSDLWLLETGNRKSRLYLRTPFREDLAAVSPDGRWLAYLSNESGGDEVYLRPFPEGGAKTLVSTGSGGNAVWSGDGHEIFYRNDRQLWAVSVKPGARLELGAPTLLFERSFSTPILTPIFDVSPDGKRFLVVEAKGTAPPTMNVVLNWQEELKKLVPIH